MSGYQKYSTSFLQLLRLYDSQERPFSLQAESVRDYNKWKRKTREKLKEIAGFSQLEPCEPEWVPLDERQEKGYHRIKGALKTEPEVFMPMYILVPDSLKQGEKRAGVIAPHGHGAGGKDSVAGVMESPAIKEKMQKYHCSYGLDLVKQGYVVFCPDARGFGERRELKEQGDKEEKILSSSCNALNFAAISLGCSLIAMWTWDLIKLIDFLQTLPFCDADRLACCGFSGGGLQTLWLTALDDRVKCAVISGYFHGFRDSLLATNFCGCNFVPHLWENMDLADIAALIAPRPLLIESGNQDSLNGKRGLQDVKEQFAKLKKAYQLFQKEDYLEHYIFNGAHIWNGLKTITFLNRYLNLHVDSMK